MYKRRVIFLILLVIKWAKSLENSEDIFSSTFQLGLLRRAEREIKVQLENYASALQKEVQSVRKFLKEQYGNQEFRDDIDHENYVSHPINAFGVISKIHNVKALDLANDEFQKISQDIRNRTKELHITIMDYYSASSSIALLQESYYLETDLIYDGIIKYGNKEFRADYSMSARDKFGIGVAAINRHWLDSGIEWLQKVSKEVDSKADPTLAKEIKDQLDNAIKVHDHRLDKIGPVTSTHRTFRLPFDPKLRKKKKYSKIKKTKDIDIRKDIKLRSGNFADLNSPDEIKSITASFHRVCQSINMTNTKPNEPALKCRYQHHNDPILLLQPFKIEEVHVDPFIIAIKDFLTPKEISHMTSLAYDKLKISKIGQSASGEAKANVRTSKTAWITSGLFTDAPDDAKFKDVYHILDWNTKSIFNTRLIKLKNPDQISVKINQKMALLTRMNLNDPKGAEHYQVANYGVGGQYGLHYDAFRWYDPKERKDQYSQENYIEYGERIATLLTYLSDVEAGGSTVFPKINIESRVSKGDAIFWINIKSNGETDPLTMHGGCPVLIGSKWICNRWIRSHQQALKFPCGLQNHQSFDFFDFFRRNND